MIEGMVNDADFKAILTHLLSELSCYNLRPTVHSEMFLMERNAHLLSPVNQHE